MNCPNCGSHFVEGDDQTAMCRSCQFRWNSSWPKPMLDSRVETHQDSDIYRRSVEGQRFGLIVDELERGLLALSRNGGTIILDPDAEEDTLRVVVEVHRQAGGSPSRLGAMIEMGKVRRSSSGDTPLRDLLTALLTQLDKTTGS